MGAGLDLRLKGVVLVSLMLLVVLLLSSARLLSAVAVNVASVALATVETSRDQHQLSKAYGWLQQATRLDVSNPTLYRSQGMVLLALGQNKQAIDALEAALAIRPDDFIARLNLARAFTRLDEPDQALAHLARLGMRCDEAPVGYQAWLVRPCMQQTERLWQAGERNKAEAILHQVLKLDDTNLWVKLRLAQATGNPKPCLGDLAPVRIDRYDDPYMRQKMAEALVEIITCPAADERTQRQVGNYLLWQSYLEQFQALLMIPGNSNITEALRRDQIERMTDMVQPGTEDDGRIIAQIAAIFGLTAAEIRLGPELLPGGNFEKSLAEQSFWEMIYQIGTPYYNQALMFIGLDSAVRGHGSRALRIQGLWTDGGSTARAGAWMRAVYKLSPGCYRFQVQYRTESGATSAQAQIWSAGAEGEMARELWRSYYYLPASNGSWATVTILGCIAQRVGGDFKLYLAASGQGNVWYDNASLRRLGGIEPPAGLIEKPVVWINGERLP